MSLNGRSGSIGTLRHCGAGVGPVRADADPCLPGGLPAATRGLAASYDMCRIPPAAAPA